MELARKTNGISLEGHEMTTYALSLIPEFLRTGVGFLLHPTPLARIPPLRGRGELKEPLCSYVIMSKNVLMSKLKIREIRIKCSVFIHVNLAD